MSSQSHPFRLSGRTLVLGPAGTKYCHDVRSRVAEALRCLGLVVDVGDLNKQVERSYDWCVLTDIPETFFGHESGEGMTDAIQRLRPYCRAVAGCLPDGAAIGSEELEQRCRAFGIDTVLDIGFLDQSAVLAPSARSLYHFIPNGLTPSEQETVSLEESREERPIPWVLIGHASAHRVALVNQLITRVDPRGFVYLPNRDTAGAKDLQQPNPRQFEAVLRKCRYHIWYWNQQPFCLDSERFHLSLLAGCVPVQVVSEDAETPSSFSFNYLVLRESEVAEELRQFNFQEIRRRFRAGFLALPSLAESLAKFLVSRSLLASRQPSIDKSQAA